MKQNVQNAKDLWLVKIIRFQLIELVVQESEKKNLISNQNAKVVN